MHKTTLWRFSKLTGIPVDDLDPKLVEMFAGDTKDFKIAYLQQQKFNVLKKAAIKSNVSFQEMLDLLEAIEGSGKPIDDVLHWLHTS